MLLGLKSHSKMACKWLRRKGKEVHSHSLSVVGSMADVETPICSNELSIKQLPSQNPRCLGMVGSVIFFDR